MPIRIENFYYGRNTLLQLEYVRAQKPGEVFDREEEWFENKGAGEPEEDFRWAREVLCSD